MRLFIAEKPSLGRAIAENLGTQEAKDGYISCNNGKDIVTWCFGHILELDMPDQYDSKYEKWRLGDLPIFPSVWKKSVSKDATKQFKVIKDLIGRADYIVNAGDPDREGQLLVDEVIFYTKNEKPVKRILLNALDEKSVKSALEEIRDNEEFAGLYDSALARSYADWLVGMNLSRAFTCKNRAAGYDYTIHVGRVQTPTLALVVRREEEIEKFKPTTHYVLRVLWKHEAGDIPTTWKLRDDMEGVDSEGRLLDKNIAEGILSKLYLLANETDGAMIQSVEQKTKQEGQRLPYSLSTLQVEAGKKYGYSPQEVLNTMQSLYEKKYTTYPRSDCNFLPINQMEESQKILTNLGSLGDNSLEECVMGADTSIVSRAWNDAKITAHHALIPTTVEADFSKLNEKEKNLYRMVALSYLAQFYPIHTYRATRVVIKCGDEEFIGNGKTVLEQGWKTLYQNSKEEDTETAEDDTMLPELSEGEIVRYGDGKVKEKITKPPRRFTESSLLQAMKDVFKFVKNKALAAQLKKCKGLGTEATRASIIEGLKKSGFVTVEKKYLIPTESGKQLIAILPDSLTYPDTTAQWEADLDKIVTGEIPFDAFLSNQKDVLNDLLADATAMKLAVNKDAPLCPNCGNIMKRHEGKYGFFWTCTGYPDCKTTAKDKKGKPDFTPKEKTKTAECPVCGKELRQIKGNFGTFWACEDRENCNTRFADYKDAPVIKHCPSCGEGFLQRAESKKKKGSYYWYCSKRCGGKLVWDKDGLPDIAE